MEAARRILDYQRNTAFVAFCLLICTAALIYLTQNLQTVLVPIVWSAFFAVPLIALIDRIDGLIVHLGQRALGTCFGSGERGSTAQSFRFPFKAVAEDNSVLLERSPASLALVGRLDSPCPDCFEPRGFSFCGLRRQALALCRSRVRILTVEGAITAQPEVNRIVESWSYYVGECSAAPASGESAPVASAPLEDGIHEAGIRLKLFLDAQGKYPAALRTGGTEGQREEFTGTLELDRSSIFSWFCSLLISMGLVVAAVMVFLLFIVEGINAIEQNASAYLRGIQDFVRGAAAALMHILPPDVVNNMQHNIMDYVTTALPGIASALLSSYRNLGQQMLMFMLYLVFWTFEPLPVNSSVARLFKSYLLLKTLVCLIFATLMSVVLWLMNCKIWEMFFVLTFLLNYIPEIGPLLAGLLMLPAILFDGDVPWNERQSNALYLIILGVVFKVITSNIIEMELYSSVGGTHMRMHPVILLGIMMIFSLMLGVTGMFLAVPIMAAVKYYMVTTSMPEVFLNPLLTFVEGSETGPHMNFVDRQKVVYGSVSSAGQSGQATPEDPEARSATPVVQAPASSAGSPR